MNDGAAKQCGGDTALHCHFLELEGTLCAVNAPPLSGTGTTSVRATFQGHVIIHHLNSNTGTGRLLFSHNWHIIPRSTSHRAITVQHIHPPEKKT